MYCANCGVKLGDTEKVCPLCGITAYHPEIQRAEVEPLYTNVHGNGHHHFNSKAAHIVVTTIFLLPAVIVLLIDLQISKTISWSGFASGALLLTYILAVLPTWFKRPNPVIFASCDVAAAILYLCYINIAVNGDWFLSFAFPVTAGLGVIIITVAALLYYVRKGKLYIFGGTSILLGLLMPIIELLIYKTFALDHFVAWCIYPALALVLIGAMLIFLAINSHAREAMEKKFFI